MLDIDGSSGGGAVVRVALGLSIATRTPVRIDGIRAARPETGLKHQHLAAVRACRDLAGADVDGAEIGARTLTFEPGTTISDSVTADIPTAGSVGLLLQPLWIAAAAADHPVSVRVDGGGTAGKWAPPVHYLEHVAFPLLDRSGHPATVDVRRHGFYPDGGALVHAGFGPPDLDRIVLAEQGDVTAVDGVSLASPHLADADVADRQRTAARRALKDAHPSLDVDIATRTVDAASPGSSILLWTDTGGTILGGDAVGERGTPAEEVGEQAASMLLDAVDSGAAVDRAMADMVVPFLGLAGGTVAIPGATDHVEATVQVANRFPGVDVSRDGDRLAADGRM
ncbi:MAG: RNA 3'-terminal phosphate cyclase [Candidatus Nanohaloarchaea archaeon]|nr:RNA 3'-terminal phosphate cyclase [Candidatus Nanohaloarchaea archaeon]